MQKNAKHRLLYFLLFIVTVFLFVLDLSFGSITIPFKEILNTLTGGTATKSSWEYIILNYRLPKAITAILVGMGLSISGLLMQTLFRNPLAGPYVLGLSSGSGPGNWRRRMCFVCFSTIARYHGYLNCGIDVWQFYQCFCRGTFVF